jgi:arylsulfatase A-like enzyme
LQANLLLEFVRSWGVLVIDIISRRRFLAGTAAKTFAVFAAQAASSRPNVLFLGVDDWRDWVGCLGAFPTVKTPNLDRLASSGLLFTNAHCAAPVCNPSRTALMTGLRPSTSGVYNNSQWWKPALPDVVTLPRYFKQNGYYVAGAGKMFHHMPGFNDPDAWHDYYHWAEANRQNGWAGGYNSELDVRPPNLPLAGVNEYRQEFDFGPVDNPESDFPDYKVASWASAFLSKASKTPFFLGIGMFRPHISWYVPRKYYEMYPLKDIKLPEVQENDLDDVPEAALRLQQVRIPDEHNMVVKKGKWKEAVQAYLACISFSDAMVGRVLAGLEAGPHKSSTIIVLWSDHGYHLGEKNAWHKFTLWEESTRVPLMFTAPGVTKAATICRRPVSLVDLYPTLVQLCGLPPKAGLDGQSLVPLLRKPETAWERPALITSGLSNHSLRDERWRYIRYADGSEELYDHQKDPKEWRNLAGNPEYGDVKQKLARCLPKTNQPDVPDRKAYRFDPRTYTWEKLHS